MPVIDFASEVDFPTTPITPNSLGGGASSLDLAAGEKYFLGEFAGQPSKSTLISDGTEYRLIDGVTGLLTSRYANVDTAITAAKASLSGGRTNLEKLVLIGFFPVTAPLILDSYTVLDIDAARVEPTSLYTGSVSVITNSLHAGVDGPKNTHIHVIGGTVDGINTYGGGVGAISNIEFKNIEFWSVRGVRSVNAREHGIAFDYSDHGKVLFNDCDTPGDDGITCHYANNNYLIMGNDCHDSLSSTSPSLGAPNGIEIENENGGTESAPINGMIIYNSCWNNDRGIVGKVEPSKTTPINHQIVGWNTCHSNTNEGIKFSNNGVGGVKMLGMSFPFNILYSNGGVGLRLIDTQSAVIHGGSIYLNGTHGIELQDCDDTRFDGGLLIYENNTNGVKGGATVTGCKFGNVTLLDNVVDESFAYAICLDGADTYIGPMTTIKDTRVTKLQLGVRVTTGSTGLTVDGTTFDGFKFGGGTRQGPLFIVDSAAISDVTVRGLKILNSAQPFATENHGTATGIASGVGVPHGLNLQADGGTLASIDASKNEFAMTLLSGSAVVTWAIDETDITPTYSGGGTIDFFYKVSAQKWAA